MITIEQAQELYDSRDPVHDFDHILRVLNMAERLAEEEGADIDVVRAAVLLHDISHEEEKDGEAEDHAVRAAERARDYLDKTDERFIQAVMHAIAAHRFSNNIEPQTLEAKVLFDADKLDAIGAVGIARVFAYAGGINSPLYRTIPDGTPVTQADRDISAYHEFRYKLVHVKDRLYTETAKRIAEERHAFMEAFFSRLEGEIKGER